MSMLRTGLALGSFAFGVGLMANLIMVGSPLVSIGCIVGAVVLISLTRF